MFFSLVLSMPETKTWLAKLLEVCLAASTPLLEGYVPTKRDVDEFLAENEHQGRRNKTLERATFSKVVKVENRLRGSRSRN